VNGIVWRFVDICRFRAGPQDVPASGFLLGLVLVAYLLIGVLLQRQEFSLANFFFLVCVDVLLMAFFIAMLLWIRTLAPRFIPAFSAFIGCGVILQVMVWLLVFWEQQAMSVDDKGLMQLLPSLLLWVWLLWNIGVVGHILRHALTINFQASVALSLMYVIISFSVIRILMAA